MKVIVILLCLSFVGCKVDNRKCLEYKTELMSLWIGNSFQLIPIQVCKKYEETTK